MMGKDDESWVKVEARLMAEANGRNWENLVRDDEHGKYIDEAYKRLVARKKNPTAVWPPQATPHNPEVDHLLSLFDYQHLPPHLRAIAHPLWSVAHEMAEHFGYDGYELIAGLRKLLEAKDCLVRQEVDAHKKQPVAMRGDTYPNNTGFSWEGTCVCGHDYRQSHHPSLEHNADHRAVHRGCSECDCSEFRKATT